MTMPTGYFLKDVGGLGAYTIYTYDVRDQVTKNDVPFFFSLKRFSYNAGPGIPLLQWQYQQYSVAERGR